MKIHIIGGGVIGLFSAYYLSKKNHQICIIDQTDGADGCSHGNAGMIVPSHFVPLAAPGMIQKGIRWMFDAKSPFYVKPRLNWELANWGIKFMQAANEKKVNAAMPALRDYGLLSKQLYAQLANNEEFNFHFEEKGLLMLCKKHETLEEEAHLAEIANDMGIEAKVLSTTQIQALEPEVKPNVVGGVLYVGDAHLNPNTLIANLRRYLRAKGVEFKTQTEIIGFQKEKNQITALQFKDAQGIISQQNVDQLILAGGSWSEQLAKKLNFSMPLQAGKGYSTTQKQLQGKRLNTPSILLEARVAITPMGADDIRFGGTMEIGGINSGINMKRVEGIVEAVPDFFPDYTLPLPPKEKIWYGLRPCSPDGLPYVGRSKQYKNLVVASGHAMMGLSLAPATGHLVQQIMDEQAPDINLNPYMPDRFD